MGRLLPREITPLPISTAQARESGFFRIREAPCGACPSPREPAVRSWPARRPRSTKQKSLAPLRLARPSSVPQMSPPAGAVAQEISNSCCGTKAATFAGKRFMVARWPPDRSVGRPNPRGRRRNSIITASPPSEFSHQCLFPPPFWVQLRLYMYRCMGTIARVRNRERQRPGRKPIHRWATSARGIGFHSLQCGTSSLKHSTPLLARAGACFSFQPSCDALWRAGYRCTPMTVWEASDAYCWCFL